MRQHNPAGPLDRQATRLNQTVTKLTRTQMGERNKIYPKPWLREQVRRRQK